MPDFSALVSQVNVDSGTLSGLSSVAHKFEAGGEYSFSVLQAGVESQVANLNIEAAPDAPVPQVQVGPIDLVQVLRVGAPALADIPQILTGAYTLFHAATSADDHAVVVAPTGGDSSGGFDSRELGPGDIFATTLIRPGTYTLTNTLLNTTGQVTVSYPVITPGTPYQPPDPATVDCNEDGFAPNSTTLMPAQGLIFHINARARITLELTTPDDGPPR